MIDAPVFPAALNGQHVPGLRNHAYDILIPIVAGTDGTDFAVREILAISGSSGRRRRAFRMAAAKASASPSGMAST
jgi:hypothetical protein